MKKIKLWQAILGLILTVLTIAGMIIGHVKRENKIERSVPEGAVVIEQTVIGSPGTTITKSITVPE